MYSLNPDVLQKSRSYIDFFNFIECLFTAYNISIKTYYTMENSNFCTIKQRNCFKFAHYQCRGEQKRVFYKARTLQFFRYFCTIAKCNERFIVYCTYPLANVWTKNEQIKGEPQLAKHVHIELHSRAQAKKVNIVEIF